MTSHSEIIHILHSKGINLSEYEKKGSVKFIRYYETDATLFRAGEVYYEYLPAVIDSKGCVWSFQHGPYHGFIRTLQPYTAWESSYSQPPTVGKGYSCREISPGSNQFIHELPNILIPLVDEFIRAEGIFATFQTGGVCQPGPLHKVLNHRFIRAMASLQPIAKYLKQLELVSLTDECLRKERSRQALDLANEMLNEAKERLDRSTSEEMRRRARISLQTAEGEVEHAEREERRAAEAFDVARSAAEHLGAERLERSALADRRTLELQAQLEAEIVRNRRLNESLEAAISAETARGRERDATLGARVQALEGQVQSLQAQLKQKEAEEARARALRHAIWQKEEKEKLEREAFKRSYF
jgi:hypothetical protein